MSLSPSPPSRLLAKYPVIASALTTKGPSRLSVLMGYPRLTGLEPLPFEQKNNVFPSGAKNNPTSSKGELISVPKFTGLSHSRLFNRFAIQISELPEPPGRSLVKNIVFPSGEIQAPPSQ